MSILIYFIDFFYFVEVIGIPNAILIVIYIRPHK